MTAASAAVTLEIGAPARPRVLLVDDEPMVRTSISRCLDRMGYAVTAVDSAAAALRAVEGSRFDAILTDFHMPGMTGQELVERLVESDPSIRARIVVTSGDLTGAAINGLVDRLGCHTLEKPFELSVLGATLRSCVQGSRSDR